MRPSRPLRFLVVSSPPAVKRLPDLYSRLLDGGAELIFTAESEGFPQALLAHPRTSAVDLPLKRRGPQAQAVKTFRAAADLVRFLGPGLETARAPRLRASRRLVRLTAWTDTGLAARRLAQIRLPREAWIHARNAFRAVEQLLPPDPRLEEAVASLDVDTVLVVTRCVLGGTDADVIKVSRWLGLPSAVLIWSWDNLSGKALLTEDPERLLLWNEVQAAEATEQHGVSPDRIGVLGAANFDRFFDEVRGANALRRSDSGEGPPTILYIGSTAKIARQEPVIFERWLAALRSSDDPALRSARVLVRPHPAVRTWDGWTPPDERTVLLLPEDKTRPATLAQLLHESDVMVALNTSAELEAAIAGRPVLTFRAGADAPGQEGSAHFAYLLEENGGFVIDAKTLDEHLARLGEVLRGGYDADKIAQFVERFIRPGGAAQPVVPVLASAILDAVQSRDGRQAAEQADRFRPDRNGGRIRSRGSRPRILVVSPPAVVPKVPDIFAAFLDADAELIFSGKRVEKLKVPEAILADPRASVVELPLVRTGEAGEGVSLLRTAADLTRFLGADLEDATSSRIRVARRLLKLAQHPEFRELAPLAADLRLPAPVQARLSSVFRNIEHLLPPPPGLAAAIDALGVDAVLLVSRCTVGGFEPDVIKTARQIGLPSLMLVWSWDNLSSKAMLNEHPDKLLVWNDVQAAEAVDLHGISPDCVEVVGAPNFDRFFDEIREAERPAPAAATGRATVLYLGSSPDVSTHEPLIFGRWLAALRASGDPLLGSAGVRVRPHPGDHSWHAWSPPDERVQLMIAPTKRDSQELARLLAEADAVVALNTSAELEAAIAERPVLTFRPGLEDAPGQEGSFHFRYLLEDRGGFVIDASTLDEHVLKLGAVLRGDYDPAPLRRFVERWIRPAGLAEPASPRVASAVLELAGATLGVGR